MTTIPLPGTRRNGAIGSRPVAALSVAGIVAVFTWIAVLALQQRR